MSVFGPSLSIEKYEGAFTSQPSIAIAVNETVSFVPDSYDIDMIRAIVQDPSHIFVYWELRRDTLRALSRYFPTEEVATFHTALRQIEVNSREESFFAVEQQDNYWVEAAPGREYEFEIGVRSPLHGYIAIVRSNRVHTPEAVISSKPPAESEYKSDIRGFSKMVEASGFSAEQVAPASAIPEEGEDRYEGELPLSPSSDKLIRA